MIFGALSNAAYRVSLRGPGAQLEGLSRAPPSDGGKTRDPAGRGLTFALILLSLFSPYHFDYILNI